LVDYGGTVRIGSPIIEFTGQYCLDASKTASETLDWICLGTTLAHIAGFGIYNFNKAIDLANAVSNSSGSQDERIKQLIVSCLHSPSLAKIETAIGRLN
jgi:hypothetical protein